ncbi:RNA polymerase sigma factor [Rhizobium bangladeshense]|uniref:RNA polymerase sigma factor n=1 Tax=Rhizobium bangladeshense TaxID=1138189 RepID=A0ABS7LM48_9HYPH|nr:RNA polymerase sigma factor [Rhizobium bangladeshense]MBX4869561.1 RNA polymerase sigma factor [Rhizobium bangladeshense]MBX4874957.1 RNA polymerase sigma factor [Rhizobium bangladeshense]MBX4885002.1 RNA polymerase sigma factor [Rhizobium bangladeshense]MBX4897315.1 RNA polymerase sigma factor [Rhizobium bangladeshense]MBX4902725.1 RNA polymerase sigma factor [Rhizobium bangladeshense]
MENVIEEIYRTQSRRVLATLIRLLGDFDRAEEALHDAFAAAARTWPTDGIPGNPFAWLVSTGRFKAIDTIRRRARFDASQQHIEDSLYSVDETEIGDMEAIEDDMLRLIFTCCHPAIPADAQTAMALREICGLTTEEIAHAFLVPAPTVAQRIVRAKNRIRAAKIPYEVPGRDSLPERLDQVLHVIYLVFNEGYSASSGGDVVRADLTAEAIRLARLLLTLLPHPDARGLLALMLLQDSRRLARSDEQGALVLLADQDRSLWDHAKIAEGLALLAEAMRAAEIGAYTVQAAIAAEHVRAPTAEETDWRRITFYYDLLLAAQPSPIVELNRAAAISMTEGPAKGLDLVDAILAREELKAYHLAHAARADFLRRLGRTEEAIAAYQRALSLCRQEPELAFLRKRISELAAAPERQ